MHLQLRFEDVPLTDQPPSADAGEAGRRSWLLRSLIDNESFQRLRSIRQNGLTNLVFHGAEHTRFTHSMGVCHLAGVMFEKIKRNCSEEQDEITQTAVMAAALLHDIGHGPFSHAMEEVIRGIGKDFDHEKITVRYITEASSSIHKILLKYSDDLPAILERFFDKAKREENSWVYRIVSSQIDADRLDYLLRDQLFTGVLGSEFDLERILDLMYHRNDGSIAVEIGALEAVEGYLFTLDQMYRTVYYHHAVRAATRCLTSAIKRAVSLHLDGDKSIFPPINGGDSHLASLISLGEQIELSKYDCLGDFAIWQHFDFWKDSGDEILADLSSRVRKRELFKTIELKDLSFEKMTELVERAKEKTIQIMPNLDQNTVEYYVIYDGPERTSYKTYTWTPESTEESIWLVGEGIVPHPIETDQDSRIIEGLKRARVFPRLIVTAEVRALLT